MKPENHSFMHTFTQSTSLWAYYPFNVAIVSVMHFIWLHKSSFLKCKHLHLKNSFEEQPLLPGGITTLFPLFPVFYHPLQPEAEFIYKADF